MSNDMDLRTSYKKFIQDLPQLLADKGPEQVYALYKAENYGSLRAGGFREEVERLASPAPHWCDQGFFRLAELYDGLQLNHGDDYFLALMNLDVSLRQSLLRHDRQFRDELLWHLFTVEGTPERSFATVDKNTFRNTWQRELLDASAEGLIPREHLLDACLASLARDFAAYRAGWFSRMYAALKPTAAESAQRQDTLVNLLGSPVGTTVTLAVKQLSAVHRVGLLDADRFVRGCAPALLTSKTNALAILKLLASLRGTVGDAPVAEASVAGLNHAHPQVQVAAAKLLHQATAAETLYQHVQNLSPVARQELEDAGLLKRTGEGTAQHTALKAPVEAEQTAEDTNHDAPPPDYVRSGKSTGKVPNILEGIRVSWDYRESEAKRPNGKPENVWWSPTVHLPVAEPHHTPDEKHLLTLHYAAMSCEELARLCPSSTAPVAVGLLERWVFLDEEDGRHYMHDMVQTLRNHPGQWNSITAQALAVLATSKHHIDRAGAAELLAENLGVLLSYEDATTGFSQTAPALMFTRWAHTFEDMAAIDPRVTLRFLGGLLPHCDRTQHGMGKLLGVYAQEYVRAHGAKRSANDSPQLSPEMTTWLGGFKGSSQAAKHARAILKTLT